MNAIKEINWQLLFLLLLLLRHVLVIELNEREQEDADDHGGGACIVGIGGGYEPLVLRVLEGPHRHGGGREQVGVADASIVHVKLEYAVHVRQLEGHLQVAAEKA